MLTSEEIRDLFAKNLSRILREKNMNQSDLARGSGLSKDAISTYTRGRSIPGPDSLAAISQALGVSPEDLVENAINSGGPVHKVQMQLVSESVARLQIDVELPLKAAMKIVEICGEPAAAHAG